MMLVAYWNQNSSDLWWEFETSDVVAFRDYEHEWMRAARWGCLDVL